MSTSPESEPREFELDRDLQLLPAWARQPSAENKYAKYEGGGDERSGRRGDRSQQRERGRERPFRRAPGRGEPPPAGRPHSGPRREGDRPPQRGRPRPEPREPLPPLPEWVSINFTPEEKGVESLARQIRLTGRAYPLFDIAALVLKKPERYTVQFSADKRPDGQQGQVLFVCGLDETLWLSEQDAVDHVLSRHFATFYQAERVETEPPKGTYTFVGQCGISGTILGPPNYHDYQTKLRKLHSERFANMPFEMYKARIKIVRDEAVVKKWIEEQSWKTQYVCLNVPEAAKLNNREDVETHFRETHLPNVIKPVESHTLSGTAAQALPSRPLVVLLRRAWEDQLRFPLKVVNVLSQQFAGHGLQFFKVNRTVTHVAVARPRYLDLEATPVSESIKRIVEFIHATPNCSRRKLLEALAPDTHLQSVAPAEGTPPTEAPAPSPEAAAIISDLHWLIHQGHVIEFSNGLMELAKKPLPRPPKSEPSSPVATQPANAASPGSEPGTSGEGSADSRSAAQTDSSEATSGESGTDNSSLGAQVTALNNETVPDPVTPNSAMGIAEASSAKAGDAAKLPADTSL